jgi:trans-2,3-dihydro-3-hydroxyanthranilate isomerase
MQVDAFTTQALGGNPCAILFETDDLPAETMLAIARENNLSETSFVRRSSVADFGARYFTPAEEIPLAGHPTIATIWALIERGEIELIGAQTRVTLELKAGIIPVDIFVENGRVTQIVMTQIKPRFLMLHNVEEVASLFGISPKDLLPDAPVQTVSTGTPQLMVPVRSLDALRRLSLDVPAYAAYRARSDFFSPHLFCLEGVTPAGRTFARHFGVPPDTMEDPFTGSATGGMAAYLWHHGLIESPAFVAEQGHWMGRPGQGYVTVTGPRNDIEAVQVGGQAATVIRGEMAIP